MSKKQMSFKFDPKMFEHLDRIFFYLGLNPSSFTKTDKIELSLDVLDDIIFSADDKELSYYRWKFTQRGFDELPGTPMANKNTEHWSWRDGLHILSIGEDDD